MKKKVIKLKENFSFLISHFSSLSGFTLIEVLVVIALMSVLLLSSSTVFFSYMRSQTFQAGVSDVVTALNKAKSNSVAQVKPENCEGKTLDGYQFWHPVSGTYYRLSAKCGGLYYIIERKNLPPNVTFTVDSTNTVFFDVSTGIVDSVKSVIITSNNETKTITVDEVGNISVE